MCFSNAQKLQKFSFNFLAPKSSPLTGFNTMPLLSDYWTTFLNVSYADPETAERRTEKTEVAR
jgi:hypothetical protein